MTRPLHKIWCGREGWLSVMDFIARTHADVIAYARAQPLKFRQACGRYATGHEFPTYARRGANLYYDLTK